MENMHFHTVHTKCLEDNFVSHSGDPNEQFDTHEKFLGAQGNLNWMPEYLTQIRISFLFNTLKLDCGNKQNFAYSSNRQELG